MVLKKKFSEKYKSKTTDISSKQKYVILSYDMVTGIGTYSEISKYNPVKFCHKRFGGLYIPPGSVIVKTEKNFFRKIRKNPLDFIRILVRFWGKIDYL